MLRFLTKMFNKKVIILYKNIDVFLCNFIQKNLMSLDIRNTHKHSQAFVFATASTKTFLNLSLNFWKFYL